LADDFGFWLLTLGFAIFAGAAAALRSFRRARLLEDTPTSRIRSAAQGYVEIGGNARLLPGTQNIAPLTQRPCVWWRYRVSKRTERGSGKGRRSQWQTVASGTSTVPFVIDDGTGECIVQPDGAEVIPTETTSWYGDTPWPSGPAGTPVRLFADSRDYRYTEDRVYEHELVHALGDFRSTASSAEPDHNDAIAARLAEWKQDQPALLRRFDLDGDGRIDMKEWEAARAAARQLVLEASARREPVANHHVLRRPEGGRLFLVSALPHADLVRRYQRQALLAFVGFVAAVLALGWLLQDVSG
jgi:hypothetical protein